MDAIYVVTPPLAAGLFEVRLPLITLRRSTGGRPRPPGCQVGAGNKGGHPGHLAARDSVA